MATGNISTVYNDSDTEEFSYSSSSSDENELFLNEGRDDTVMPYMYEPVKQDGKHTHSEKDVQADGDVTGDRIGNTDWCVCGICEVMAWEVECLCCKEVPPVVQRLEQMGKKCVTELDGFKANCLNIDVLEASFYEFLVNDHGPLGEDEEIHKIYRHLAYRRFTRYIWKILGHKVRRVIPACAVGAIRKQFPSETYTHFKYPRP